MRAEVDYYAVMGLGRLASPDEVKLAYRRLALLRHPDRNHGERRSGEAFKLLLEAYEVLSDPETRSRYDSERFPRAVRRERPRPAEARPQGEEEARSRVDEIFNGLGEKVRCGPAGFAPVKGADLRFNLTVDFTSALFGASREVAFMARETCRSCSGTGARRNSRLTPCPLCFGRGAADRSGAANSCSHCLGHGVLAVDECLSCAGEGMVRVRRDLRVRIPPGCDTGARLKVAGEGEPGIGDGPPGDLYVVVTVEEHPFFFRQGLDVVCELPLTFAQAALGGEVEAPTVEGAGRVRVPPGVRHGEMIKVRGGGVPRGEEGTGRGDMKYVVSLEVPRNLSRRQRELLAEFQALEGADSPAEQFRRRMRDFFR